MIVVDTNVIGYLYLASDRSREAEATLRRDPQWAAPLLWRSELRNVLALYLRRGILDLGDAQGIMEAATELLRGREYEVASPHVLRLAAASGCSAYDCEFVALAEDLEVPLVTADARLAERFPETVLPLEAFAAA